MAKYTMEDIYSILEERVNTNPNELLITTLSNIKADLFVDFTQQDAHKYHMNVFNMRLKLGYIGIDFKEVWDLFDGNILIQTFLTEQIFSNISMETTLVKYFSDYVDTEGLSVFTNVEMLNYFNVSEIHSTRDKEFYYMRYIMKRINELSAELEKVGVEEVSDYTKFRLENDSLEIQFLDIYSFSSFNNNFDDKILDILVDFIHKMMAVEKSLKIV